MVALVAGESLPGEKLAVPVTGFGDTQGTSASASGHDSLASRGGAGHPPPLVLPFSFLPGLYSCLLVIEEQPLFSA